MENRPLEKQVIRILYLASASNNQGNSRLGAELPEIRNKLSSNGFFEIMDRQAVKPNDVLQTILNYKPNIVHFSAHRQGATGIFFEDEQGETKIIPPDALAALFKLVSEYVKCVFISACFLEKQAKAISQFVPIVIGTNKEIPDSAAIRFSTGFYTTLNPDLSQKSILRAFDSGCIAMKFENLPEHLTPVLIEGAPEIRFSSEVDTTFLSITTPKGLIFEALRKGLTLTGKKMGVPDDIVLKLLNEKIAKLEMHNSSMDEYEKYLKNILRDEFPLSETSTMALLQLQNGLDLSNEDVAIIKNKILNDPKLNSPENWYDRGRGQTDLNNDEKAIEYFTKAIERDPDYSAAYYERGYCYDKIGMFDLAIQDFTKAIEYNNKWEVISNLTLAYYSRARTYFAIRSEDENKEKEYLRPSLDDWNKTLELNPNQSEAYYGRGLVYEKLGMYNEAIADFARSYGMSTTEERKRNNVIYLAKCYYFLGNSQEATKWMQLLKGDGLNLMEESNIEL